MAHKLTALRFSGPVWANAERTAIDVDVVFKELGDKAVPFTASKNDPEAHGRALFDAIVKASARRPIGDYVPPKESKS